jgi:FlaG/FlaF family flagellin (archaellin)
MLNHQKEAVSPIISTVLLIGMCVTFATVMFVWVSRLAYQTGFVPISELLIIDKINTTGVSSVSYIILVKTFRPSTEPQELCCYIVDEFELVQGSFLFPEKPETLKEGNVALNGTKITSIIWYSKDFRVSTLDVINITIYDTDDDERAILATYSFCLRHTPTGGSLVGVVRFD